MKINKEFIPLILGGKKIYEFRNSDNKEGVYSIYDNGNEYIYYLKFFGWGVVHHITSDRVFYLESGEPKQLIIDRESYNWIQKNKDWYFKNGAIYVYEWIESDFEELEDI